MQFSIRSEVTPMKPVLFLRIASVLTLIHSALHTLGGVFGKPAPGVAAATDAVMRANQFVVFGVTRTYFDFLRGMGLGVSIFLTAEILIAACLGTAIATAQSTAPAPTGEFADRRG
jgi:hypothetical protein